MVAIPVSTLGKNPIIADYFGKSKWFAFFNEGTISFEKNKFTNGCEIVDWLCEQGVKKAVVSHIGLNPFLKLKDKEIECLHVNNTNTLREILDKIARHEFVNINHKNQDIIIDLEYGCNETC
ncbi:MAG: hypothetical protein IE909_00095 [Campylobacterales bacterium]|nr:hypothetical protein [Campylobacterales bacterium]